MAIEQLHAVGIIPKKIVTFDLPFIAVDKACSRIKYELKAESELQAPTSFHLPVSARLAEYRHRFLEVPEGQEVKTKLSSHAQQSKS